MRGTGIEQAVMERGERLGGGQPGFAHATHPQPLGLLSDLIAPLGAVRADQVIVRAKRPRYKVLAQRLSPGFRPDLAGRARYVHAHPSFLVHWF